MYYPDHRLGKSLKTIRLEQARRIHNNKNAQSQKLAARPVVDNNKLDARARKVA